MSDVNAMGSGRPARKRYLVAALALVIFALAGLLVASHSDPNTLAGPVDVAHLPVGPKVPGLSAAKGWINSPPLHGADLTGRVVLYDFWTYSCVNCVRAIPYVRSWYDRYAKDGLVVVGIHSPEFDFEKNHGNVQDAVKRLHVDYPVALDDNMAIWNAFGNQYWPADYIADRQGRLRHAGIGEGNYTETENILRSLLGVSASAPRATRVNEGNVGKPPAANDSITPETYLGLERGTAGAQPGVVDYPDVATLENGQARLVGRWEADQQYVRSAAPGATVAFAFHAREVNLVMATAAPNGQPIDVRIELDGGPLPLEDRTAQTMVDAQGNTFVRVTGSDLYRLVLGTSIGSHTLRLVAQAADLEAFAFYLLFVS